MSRKTAILRIAQALIILNALVWFAVGVANLFLSPRSGSLAVWMLVIAVGMIGYGTVLLITGIFLGRGRKKLVYYLALGLITLTVILPIFDDIGLADLLAVLPGLLALVYLLRYKKLLSGEEQVENPKPIPG